MNIMPFHMSKAEIMADKYITWSVSLQEAATSLEAKGGDGSNLRKLAGKSAKKAIAILA